jgi:tRNA pseudouridine38-40 synthase
VRNILLRLAFVGTNYAGWQRQQNDTTVQGVVEQAIKAITGERVSLVGCSRTDAGVHAEDYVANFRTAALIPADRFQPAIQTKLPRDIQILASKEVTPEFNARRCSYEKTYRYQIVLGTSPFFQDRWWQYAGDVDFSLLPELAGLVVGMYDFSGFCVRKSLKNDNRCTIKDAAWRKSGKKLYFKITGDRFLHHMVRFLVGAQFEVAAGRLTRRDFEVILKNPAEKRALYPAPAEGLYLMKVKIRQFWRR